MSLPFDFIKQTLFNVHIGRGKAYQWKVYWLNYKEVLRKQLSMEKKIMFLNCGYELSIKQINANS